MDGLMDDSIDIKIDTPSLNSAILGSMLLTALRHILKEDLIQISKKTTVVKV